MVVLGVVAHGVFWKGCTATGEALGVGLIDGDMRVLDKEGAPVGWVKGL